MSDVAEDLIPLEAEDVSPVVAVATTGIRRCERCQGRLLVDRVTGDAACFNCGNVVYLHPPISILEPGRREPRRMFHGRIDIS